MSCCNTCKYSVKSMILCLNKTQFWAHDSTKLCPCKQKSLTWLCINKNFCYNTIFLECLLLKSCVVTYAVIQCQVNDLCLYGTEFWADCSTKFCPNHQKSLTPVLYQYKHVLQQKIFGVFLFKKSLKKIQEIKFLTLSKILKTFNITVHH